LPAKELATGILLINEVGSLSANDYFGGINFLDFGKNSANADTQETVSLGYLYLMNGFNCVMHLDLRGRGCKDQIYYKGADDQIRIGWQYLFN
jgi:hypothetical protein